MFLEPALTIEVPANRWSWNNAIDLAMLEIERELRARKGTAEPIELGRLGLRTKQRLRACVAAFALHYLFEQVNTQGDAGDGKFIRKANMWRQRAEDWLNAESTMIDYDYDNSGTIDDFEKNQPIPTRFIRG